MSDPAIVPPGAAPWIRDHVRRYLATDGADGHLFMPGVPTLLLTTTGRKSGRRYVLPLTYGVCETGFMVIASKGGAPTPPDWSLNLMADPDVEVQVQADRFPATARIARGEERGRLWSRMIADFPLYEDYQRTAGRELDVVVLERARR